MVFAGYLLATAQTKPAQPKAGTNRKRPGQKKEGGFPPAVAERGKSLFGQNCAFCHGRDGGGGESGPT